MTHNSQEDEPGDHNLVHGCPWSKNEEYNQ